MREEFEKLPEIAERLKHVWWDENRNQYCDTGKHPNSNGAYLNGALYAFQEPQKRIDTVLKAVEWHIEDCGIGEDTEYNKAWLEAMLFVKQELLK